MCEASYKPQDINIGFVYNVILDGRIIGYIPETLTALFIKKLRTLKVIGKQVNIIYIKTLTGVTYKIVSLYFSNSVILNKMLNIKYY